jgi:hypothetical protein
MAGIGTFLGGIGAVLEKGATYIPGYVEKLKNEREKLLEEQIALKKGVSNEKTIDRYNRINDRLIVIDRLLRNKAKD